MTGARVRTRDTAGITIEATGPGLAVQDLGRAGHAQWGVGQGGAADRGSLRLANRLVGNPEACAAFEVLLGGAAFRFPCSATIAVTGAPCPISTDAHRERPFAEPFQVVQGTVLRLSPPPQQLRTYLAVRGGLATARILGSRSVDETSGIGNVLRVGDAVPIGMQAGAQAWTDVVPQSLPATDVVTLHAVRGPRDDWFTDDAMRVFTDSRYLVAADSNRVGTRLTGPALARSRTDELLSEPTLRGAVEVPGDGQPIVFGADHPTTCGYPVIAVLDGASADLLAQCRPGQTVRFVLRRPAIRLTRSGGR